MDSEPAKLRVMVDTSVLIAGSGWPRWPHEVILAGLRGTFQLVLCPYVIRQAERVLQRRFPAHLERFAEFLAQTAWEIVPDPSPEDVARHIDLVRDVTDVPIALAAIHAGVDYLVSEDKDLTAQDATTAALRQQLTVLLSGTFLRQVLGWRSEALEEIRQRTWRDLEP
jgi:predicted nucleic acid-binding protein